ncbi:BTAD domain-containing putative transcriptional regulator [Actinokineospora sp. HUAS TT18]|uniref:AfsR/SARP family transcriptional regulator n=1 Tax=Actinokineospora sp. HUAS TT18 TaxID=3447451 RepID=UPI003F527B23
MEFRLLGDVEVAIGGKVGIPRRRERLLLAVLLLDQGRSVSAERLIDLLWDGVAPPTAAASLRSHVSRLRAVLPDLAITRQDAGYRVEVDPDTVDAHRFQRLVREAAGEPAERRSVILAEALALWRGPALADVAPESVRSRLCSGLEELRLSALEQRLAADLDLGRDLVAELTELVSAHPIRERFVEYLMVALHRAGRQADALRLFESTRRVLAEDLGVDPGPGLREAHEQILRADTQPTESTRNTLPASPGGFTGRVGELAAVVTSDSLVVAIDGMAGVGKTALALRAAHDLADRYPDGLLYLDLHAHTAGRGPVSPTTALASLLRAMGVSPERIPPSLDDRAAAWRAEVHAKRVLMVLDNAEGVDQVLPLLPGGPGTFAIVTSRRRLGALRDAGHVSLTVLPEREAVALFDAAAPGRHDPDAVEDVVALCGRLPLAIRIAAARLRDRPSWDVRHLADRLRAERERGGRATDAVSAAFALSYEQLSAEHQHMFRRLSAMPGNDVDAYAAAALAGIPAADAGDLLEDLLDVHLVEQRGPGRYSQHDLLCGYAGALVSAADRTAAVDRLIDYYLEMTDRARVVISPTGTPKVERDTAVGPLLCDDFAAMAWCDAERANVLAAIRAARGAAVCGLARNLVGYFIRGFHLDDGITAHVAAVSAARTLGDADAELLSVLNLGVLHWRGDDYGSAITCAERALELTRLVGDARREVACLNRIGLFRLSLGEYTKAAEATAAALSLAKAVDDVREEGVALWISSGVDLLTGASDTAYRKALRALEIDRELGDRHGICETLIRLGSTCAELGRHAEGKRCLVEAVDVAREITDLHAEAAALIELGAVNRLMGALGEGTTAVQNAMRTLSMIRQPGLLAAAHRVRGDILFDQGRPQEAAVHHRAAVKHARSIGNKLELARAFDGLAADLSATGDRNGAARQRAAARELYSWMGIRDEVDANHRLVV